MILGIDASTALEVEQKNPHYSYKGKEVEPFSFLHDHNGVTSLRIRLWVDPYDEEGHPYGGGTNDFPAFVKLAKMAMMKGYDILLDLHYSDFWCDPSKQTLPKAWRGLSLPKLGQKVYDYTKKTLLDAKKEGIAISSIQIGNEITNGFLWPFGRLDDNPQKPVRDNYDSLAFLLKQGLRASREVLPEAKLLIHLERSGDLRLHQEFFDEMRKRDVDFDVIGLSYYPYWHGTFQMFFRNVDNLRSRYGKPLWLIETGYGFTMEPFVLNGNAGANLISEDFFQKQTNAYITYPLTQEGQRDFILTLLTESAKHGIQAIYYWEPFWLPLPGLEWASIYGERYIGETGKPTNNEWANQCLFDYQGNATLGLDVFKK